MKKCTIIISTKDGKIRKYEGPMLFVSYSSMGMCRVIDESEYDDKVLDTFAKDEIDEMSIHMIDVDSYRVGTTKEFIGVKEVV